MTVFTILMFQPDRLMLHIIKASTVCNRMIHRSLLRGCGTSIYNIYKRQSEIICIKQEGRIHKPSKGSSLYLPMLSADDHYKQLGPRLGPTFCRA